MARPPSSRRIEVTLTADATAEEQLGLLVLFACYVILVTEKIRAYAAGGG